MTKNILAAFLCLGLFAVPVHASAQDAPKKTEVPFRTDSGLITAEYELATGKYMQALESVNKVLQRHPQNADAYAYRGFAYQQLGDIKNAALNYKKALMIDPAHLGALKYLGTLFVIAGEQARAMEQLQAIRTVCGASDCEELNELQSEINKSKAAVEK